MSEKYSDWSALDAFVVAKLQELHDSGSLLPESSDMEVRLTIGAVAYDITQRAYELMARSGGGHHNGESVQPEPVEGVE